MGISLSWCKMIVAFLICCRDDYWREQRVESWSGWMSSDIRYFIDWAANRRSDRQTTSEDSSVSQSSMGYQVSATNCIYFTECHQIRRQKNVQGVYPSIGNNPIGLRIVIEEQNSIKMLIKLAKRFCSTYVIWQTIWFDTSWFECNILFLLSTRKECVQEAYCRGQD